LYVGKSTPNSKEMEGFSIFFCQMFRVLLLILIIDSLFNIRVLFKEVVENFQTFIKSPSVMIFFLQHEKESIRASSLGLEDSPNTRGI
jgi:hypothetical protein